MRTSRSRKTAGTRENGAWPGGESGRHRAGRIPQDAYAAAAGFLSDAIDCLISGTTMPPAPTRSTPAGMCAIESSSPAPIACYRLAWGTPQRAHAHGLRQRREGKKSGRLSRSAADGSMMTQSAHLYPTACRLADFSGYIYLMPKGDGHRSPAQPQRPGESGDEEAIPTSKHGRATALGRSSDLSLRSVQTIRPDTELCSWITRSKPLPFCATTPRRPDARYLEPGLVCLLTT